MNKKAFFFTLISLLILTIFIVMFSNSQTVLPDTTLYSERAQIEIATSFTRDLREVYLERALRASSYRAMLAIEDYVNTTGPIDDYEYRFQELLLNGTLYGVKAPRLDSYTMPNWSKRIVTIASDEFRIDSNISFYAVSVYQESPWLLNFAADVNMITNYSGIVFNMGGSILTNQSLIGFNDPLFINNRLKRQITVDDPGQWNATMITYQILNKTFRHSSMAPNYLMRLENDTHASVCCGMVSLLNGTLGNYSYIDYLYFNKTDWCPNALFNISDVWDDYRSHGFKIDGPHLFWYGFHDDDENATLINCT